MPKKEKQQKQCSVCKKYKEMGRNFYQSDLPAYQLDGRYPICKDCLEKELQVAIDSDPFNQEFIHRFQKILQDMNKPFIYSNYVSAVDEIRNGKLNRTMKSIFGIYYKNIMFNYRTATWADSIFNDVKENKETKTTIGQTQPTSNLKKFKITKEVEDKWGLGYTSEEYYQFERKYNKLILNYPAKTALHVENLKTYIRFRVKEQIATASGSVKEAKEWGTLASKAATDAKLNASQLSKSDLSGGVDVLSQLFEAVENEDGLIPLLPKVLEQPYDDVDLIIWATINYNRRLEGKESIEYKSVWNFYDDMLSEYAKMQGMTDDQLEEYKSKRNNVFRDLSKMYKEPLYDEGDL